MIRYRKGTKEDWPIIANIHTVSWQEHYRGVVSDDYLDNIVVDERKQVWEQRFAKPNDKMITIIAENEEKVIGFACSFLDFDEEYGTMLDNLHVLSSYHGLGIGRNLMIHSAHAISTLRPKTPVYLYVLESNTKAIGFYEKMGGVKRGGKAWKTPDGSNPVCDRYVWDNAKTLAERKLI